MATGFLYGFITLPIGGFVGGLVAGYPMKFILFQIIPITFVAILIAILLRLIPEKLVKSFILFGKIIAFLALLGAVIGIVAQIIGIDLNKNHYLNPITSGLEIVGSIIIVLPGAYVIIALLSRIFQNVFIRFGKIIGINETAVLGLLSTLANSIPTFAMIKDMDEKGKIVNFAFLTGGAFALGDYLGFCAAVAPHLIVPMIIAKITAACSAILIVLIFWKSDKKSIH